MNIKRLLNNQYLTWDEYERLVLTMEFVGNLAKTRTRKEKGGEW